MKVNSKLNELINQSKINLNAIHGNAFQLQSIHGQISLIIEKLNYQNIELTEMLSQLNDSVNNLSNAVNSSNQKIDIGLTSISQTINQGYIISNQSLENFVKNHGNQ